MSGGKNSGKIKQAKKLLTKKGVLAGVIASTEGENFDNFLENLDLQEWLERLEKELNQIKAKLKG